MINPNREITTELIAAYESKGFLLDEQRDNFLALSGSLSFGAHTNLFRRFIEIAPSSTFVTTFYDDPHESYPANAATWRQIMPAQDKTYIGQIARPLIERGWIWQRDTNQGNVTESEQVFVKAGIGGCFPLVNLSFETSGKFRSMSVDIGSYTDLMREYAWNFSGEKDAFSEIDFTGAFQNSRSISIEKLSGTGVHILPTHRGYRVVTPQPLNGSLNKTPEKPGLQASFGNYWFKLYYDEEQIDFCLGRVSQADRLVFTAQAPKNIDFDFVRHQAAIATERTRDRIPEIIPVSFSVPALGVAA